MPYPKKLLNDYETVALDLHPHWWFFAGPAVTLIASIIIGIVSLTRSDGNATSAIQTIALVMILVSAVWLVIRYLRWSTTNFVITSDRIIYRSGVIGKRGIEIPLERVNNVSLNQTVFERIVGAGDLLIESGGEAGQQRFTDIRRPGRVQNLIHAQMEVNETRRFANRDPAAAPVPVDVASQLEKLEGLLQRGTLTQEEFDGQKRKLLNS